MSWLTEYVPLPSLVALGVVAVFLLYAALTWRLAVARRRRVMTAFPSTEAFFHAVDDLIAGLEGAGHHQAAVALRNGYRCLNGLTDGWALFLDAIERVRATDSKRFAREHQEALETIRAAVHFAVHRR